MSITLSDTAIQEINRLIEIDENKECGLRLGIKGGGCSGLSYVMQFEKTSRENDKIIEIEGEKIKVFVDPKSYLYLNGLILDYTKELIGGGFKFSNPNATKSCACGTSFSS